MPVERRVQTLSRTRTEELLEKLLREWRAQQPGEGEPLIIEEAPSNADRPNHLYVVWSEWGDLTPIERSKLIMQAYERYHGRDLAASITLAMGLIPAEAKQMGIVLGS